MRVVGRFPDKSRASAAIDSLKKIGLDRKDMIVSQIKNDELANSEIETEEISFVQTEREGLGESKSFIDGISGLKGKGGIVIAVEVSKHDRHKIRELMEQSGASEIVED